MRSRLIVRSSLNCVPRVLATQNLDLLILISTEDTFNLGSMLNLLISVIPQEYDYHAGYRIKIIFICRLTKAAQT